MNAGSGVGRCWLGELYEDGVPRTTGGTPAKVGECERGPRARGEFDDVLAQVFPCVPVVGAGTHTQSGWLAGS